jgi:two-component system nitrate/nitrite response regulator NarL
VTDLPDPTVLACKAQGRVVGRAHGTAISVVVVDDNKSFLDASCALLRREGLEVSGVASTSAVAVARVEDLQPDVVLIDINLAGESGLDLARQLLKADRSRQSRVILMSTTTAADLGDLIAESPATGFLTKAELSADAIRRILDGGNR